MSDFRIRNRNGYDSLSMATGKEPLNWKASPNASE